MKKEFWLQKWETGDIRFHRDSAHPALSKYFSKTVSGRVFVPFCGKSSDLTWFTDRGWHVIGSEFSSKACENYFNESGIPYTKLPSGQHIIYRSDHLEIWCGDHFELKPEIFKGVTAWYDRAALVALPAEMRLNYFKFIRDKFSEFNQTAFQMLLVAIEYDQTKAEGPPFSVSQEEVRANLGQRLEIKLLERFQDPALTQNPRFQGLETMESIYELRGAV